MSSASPHLCPWLPHWGHRPQTPLGSRSRARHDFPSHPGSASEYYMFVLYASKIARIWMLHGLRRFHGPINHRRSYFPRCPRRLDSESCQVKHQWLCGQTLVLIILDRCGCFCLMLLSHQKWQRMVSMNFCGCLTTCDRAAWNRDHIVGI